MKLLRHALNIAICCLFFFGLCCVASAQHQAIDITPATRFLSTGYSSAAFLKDGDPDTYHASAGNTTVRLSNSQGIGSLYLLFDLEYGAYTICDNHTGAMHTAGTYGFLHEYVPVEEIFGYTPTSVTIHFSHGAVHLSEIYVFSSGAVPSYVQQWQPPLDNRTDILLFAAHGDDDQLYFAGLFPLYAGQRQCNVQVAYMTDHRNLTNLRTHEMLNGLWNTGVDAYPVFGSFPDFRIDFKSGTYRYYEELGYDRQTLLGFVVEQLRRFKPLVVVGHDFDGEYGHGMHKVYADLLATALTVSADADHYPELASRYGVWDVPKAYFHLYGKRRIVIDYDTPLESFGGLTAFQVTQQYGFPCHKTQQFNSFVRWLYGDETPITKASQIRKYNPAQFGLYRTTVGKDKEKNDFLENIITYSQLEREEAERLEAERLEAERLEAERLEAERLEAERLEAERLEAERLEAERLEAERLEAERLEAERLEAERQKLRQLLLWGLSAAVILTAATVLLFLKKKRR